MSVWLFTLGSWLIDFGWVATVLLVCAGALRLMIRDAGGRVLVAWGTWLSLLGGAVLVALPSWPRYELSRLIEPRVVPMAADVVMEQPTLEQTVTIRSIVAETANETAGRAAELSWAINWQTLLAGTWLLAAIVAGGWMAGGFHEAQRLLRTSREAPRWIVDELRRIAAVTRPAADVRISGRVSSAVALGTIWPRIVLPEGSAVETNAATIRAALAHEWAHIRHGDLWLLAVERLLVPLLALHPLFWWLRRKTRLDQELLADAAAAGGKPVEYAEALVAWAKTPSAASVGWAGLAMWERKTNLLWRVQMILSSKRHEANLFGRWCGIAAATLVMALGGTLSMVTVRPLTASEEPQVKASTPDVREESKPAAVAGLSEATAAEPPAENATAAEKREYSITLQLSLWALDRGDFQETRKEVVGAVEWIAGKKLEQAAELPPTAGNQARPARSIELEPKQADKLTSQLKSLDGVKLVSQATVIAFNWQEAQVSVLEPSAQVFFTQEVDGKVFQRTGSQSVSYHISVRPWMVKGNENQVEMSIDASRARPNDQSPRAALTAKVEVNKTLFFFGTEPFVILISPTKVERKPASAALPTGPMLPSLTERIRAVTQGLPASNAAPQTVAPVTALPATTIPGLPGVVTPVAPATTATAPPVTPSASNTPEYRPTNYATPTPIPAAGLPTMTAAVESRQTERKLLELDLAEAKLGVEEAEAGLGEAQRIRSTNPAAVSQQELRKRQLEVERAKIRVKRIEIQLEEPVKSGAATTPRAGARATEAAR